MITFQEALEIIKSKDKRGNPVPFDIEFVTANLKKKTGGEIIKMEQMVFLWPKSSGHARNPNLFMNGTINIHPNGGKKITSVHLILIHKINSLTLA